MGLVILYHGSTVEIKEIDLSLSKPNKDFGKGFYLSDNFVQAYELASLRKICIALGCEIGGIMEVNSVEGER
ncbi:MAG: DUF3990 domain-containing protein [Treponema sp.]|nr:DUF3990 domain-containing protein [Treponema sp.]